jgi:predicted acylesterase/phospholipase RssA
MEAMAQEKLANHPVDIYLQPPIMDIEMLDFHKAELIYQQGLAAKDDFKRKLEHLLEGKSPLIDWLRRKR